MQAAEEAEATCSSELNTITDQLAAAEEELARQSGTQPMSSKASLRCLDFVIVLARF